jgi:hypothetical protein
MGNGGKIYGGMLDAGYWMLDAGCSMLDARYCPGKGNSVRGLNRDQIFPDVVPVRTIPSGD